MCLAEAKEVSGQAGLDYGTIILISHVDRFEL